jgi:hypothetical protein
VHRSGRSNRDLGLGHRGARSVGVGLSLLLSVVFSAGAGCSSTSECAAGCTNVASLSGTTTIDESITQLDVRLCVDSDCHEGTLDLTPPDGGLPCLDLGPDVCVTSVAGSRSFDVRADSYGGSGRPPDGAMYHLQLSDHASHAMLLDVTRAARYGTTVKACGQTCWRAEMTF